MIEPIPHKCHAAIRILELALMIARGKEKEDIENAIRILKLTKEDE